MSKGTGKNILLNLSGKYCPDMLATCQKLLYHATQSAADALKTTSKKQFRNSRSIFIYIQKKLLMI